MRCHCITIWCKIPLIGIDLADYGFWSSQLMVFLCHAIWYKVSWKSFSIVKTKLSFRNLWDQKSYNKESDTTKHDYASINYYIIIHCQIGHVNKMLSFNSKTSKKFKNVLPSSQCTPVKSMSLHSHAGPLSVDMQTPLFWQGFWWSQVLMVVDRTPCNNIFQKSYN